jgi:hypothetical protein
MVVYFAFRDHKSVRFLGIASITLLLAIAFLASFTSTVTGQATQESTEKVAMTVDLSLTSVFSHSASSSSSSLGGITFQIDLIGVILTAIGVILAALTLRRH